MYTIDPILYIFSIFVVLVTKVYSLFGTILHDFFYVPFLFFYSGIKLKKSVIRIHPIDYIKDDFAANYENINLKTVLKELVWEPIPQRYDASIS